MSGKNPLAAPTRRHSAPKVTDKEVIEQNNSPVVEEETKEQIAATEAKEENKDTDIISEKLQDQTSSMKEKILELLPEKDEIVPISLSLSGEAVKLLDDYCSKYKKKRSPVIDVLIKQVFK